MLTPLTQCNGELPCIRCKTDGILCRPSVHRKIIYKQLPRGYVLSRAISAPRTRKLIASSYVEGLESTQLTLTATIRELYSKLHSVGAWEYGEPDLDDCGQPIVQSIAQKLDFVRPKRVTGLPYMALPGKNASSITGPTCQLGGQRPQDYNELWASLALAATQESASFAHYRADKVLHSWSHSDGEQDYPRQAFQQNLSPIPLQNSAAENDFDFIMASVNPGYASIFSAELLSPTDFPPLPDTITDIEWISTEGAVLL